MRFHIAFEGPIAAGKTTWARLLGERLGASLLLEAFAENEFLVDYYADRGRWALPMQLWFLTERHRQLSSTPFDGPVVADYAFLKEAVFSKMVLLERELRLYDAIRNALNTTAPTPSVLVFVDARTEILLSRIRERGRSYETAIDATYLDQLRERYAVEVAKHPCCVHLDTSDIDLSSRGDVDAAIARLAGAIKPL
jgi:deoxyadenosine/deoxycytidine kinase